MVKVSEAGPVAGSAPLGQRGRPRLWRWLGGAVIVAVVLVGASFGYSRFLAPAPQVAAPQTVPVRRGTITSSVSTTGTVAPLSQAKLTFRASGRVASVSVKVGDTVAKDQSLATLDTTDLALAVSQQKAALSTAQAKLTNLKTGSRTEDVTAAQVQLDAAKSKLDLVLAGGRVEDIASAKAGVAGAQAKLSQLKNSPLPADLKAAEQGVSAAQAALAKSQADLTTLRNGSTAEEIHGGELAVAQAKSSLWSAQISRDGTCARSGFQCDSANASVASSQTALEIAQNSLAKLKLPAKPAEINSAEKAVVSAQSQLASAQSKLEQVKAGSTAEDIAAQQAAVTQAEQSLILKQKPYTDADIQAQRQVVAQAEANLATKKLPNTDADLQSAQAGVDQAQAALDLANYNLANAALLAPFTGVVNTVGYNLGEQTGSSASIVVVDPKDIRLDVNVDETDIAKIAVGQKADVTFDAIQGKDFAGTVTAIAPTAVVNSGVATYSVSIGIPEPGIIRPGMTGNANVVYGEQTNALMVPNRAIRSQGKSRVVEVLLADGQRETRPVTIGMQNDQMTEVTEGVTEGDQLVIAATTSQVPRVGGGPPQPAAQPKPAAGGS